MNHADLVPFIQLFDSQSKGKGIPPQFGGYTDEQIGAQVELLKTNSVGFDIVKAVVGFSNDLTKIGIDMPAENLFEYVLSNESAIRVRFLTKLEPKLSIGESDQKPFWEHMQTVWNLSNPENQINFVESSSYELANNIFGKVGSLSEMANINAENPQQGIFEALNNTDILQTISKLFSGIGSKDGQVGLSTKNIKGLVNELLNGLPDDD